MFKTISNIFKIADLRSKILFTLGVLIIYRIGTFIPVPSINTDALKQADSAQTADIFGLLNTFSGGALKNFSIFAMGIMPYITSSIIVQLLSMDVIPKFAQWAKEGENGRRKLAQYTRYGTIILGFIQGYATAVGFNRMYNSQMVTDPKLTTFLVIATVLAAGTAFLMWIGEQLNEYGIGNGISILIFAGIVSHFPTQVHQLYSLWFTGDAADQMFMNIVKVVVVVLVIIGIIAGVIFIQQGVRKIPIQYAQQVAGRKAIGGQNTHLPLKVNAAGVIPVIFALSLLFFPATIAQFWSTHAWAKWITNNLTYQQPLGMALYVLLIVGFTYFYTFIQMNPVQMADDLKKNGGYIPGIRPGEPTGVYLSRVMSRITLFGALFLAVISVLPIYFGKLASLPTSISIGGTSLLIVIGVALDTMKQVNSQLMKRHYKGFINK